MKKLPSIIGVLLLSLAISCNAQTASGAKAKKSESKTTKNEREADLKQYSKAYFASGCFWCVEAIFESVKGVKEAISGYAGGEEKNPTYRQVSAGSTGHTETDEVYYDSTLVDYQTLIKVFYGSHDPTTVNGQHPDYGTQYRSAIFYANDSQKKIAEAAKKKLNESGSYSKPIVTEIAPITTFWQAEDYHQNYERLNPEQPYVKQVSIPRLNKFKAKFPELLKESHED